MDYEQFKQTVFKLAKKQKKSHLIPNNNILYNLYTSAFTPETVVEKHCTIEMQKLRSIE